MSKSSPLELRVGVDVGCHSHNVAIGLSSGEILDEFEVSHNPEGFHLFFSRVEKQQLKYDCPVAVACSNLVAGRALVSMGLLAQMTVEEKFDVGDVATKLPKDVRVQVRVLGPSWVSATNVVLFANGVVLREQALNPIKTSGIGVKDVVNWTIPRPAHDVHLVALATGPEVTAPFWAIPKPYQPTSPKWTGRVLAATNPIWLDADGDGRFTAARGYARQLVERHGTNPQNLLPALARFDEATAAQAASLCVAGGVDINSDSFRRALDSAEGSVRRGFESFAATQK